MNADELLARLDGARRNGAGWVAKCPGHEDKHASLKIDAGDDGKLLLHCFAGCSVNAIVAAIGIEICDLFPARRNGAGPAPIRAPAAVATVAAGGLAWLANYCAVPVEFLETLPLATTADGRVAFTFDPGGPRKLRKPGSKDFAWAPAGAAAPALWPAPTEVLAQTIWLAEGETDAIVALHIGLPAYSVTKGAATPLTSEQATALKRRGVETVCVTFDTDGAGRAGAGRQAEVLAGAGLVVKVVDLATAGLVDPLAGRKDIRDAWLRLRDAAELRRRLEAAADCETTHENRTAHLRGTPFAVRLGLREVDAADLAASGEPGELDSLSLLGRPGYIIRGWGNLLAGYPKAGKTELLFACCRAWLAEGLAIVWLSEESQAVWQHRLHAAPDLPRGLRLVFAIGADPDDLLGRAAGGDEQVVVVDTIRNLLRLRDENDNAEIASTLGAWEASLQTKTRIYVHHDRKQSGDHGQAIAGGGAFLGVVDRAIELRFDQHDKNRRQLIVHSRIVEPPDLLYELTGAGLRAIGEPDQVALHEVEVRALDTLNCDYRKAREVFDFLDDPKPSLRQLQEALRNLHRSGRVERDPAEDRNGVTYRYRLPADPENHTANGVALYVRGSVSVPEADAGGPAMEVFEL